MSRAASPSAPTLRVAPAISDFARVLAFYRDGLGLEVLGKLEGHEGFDGLTLVLCQRAWP